MQVIHFTSNSPAFNLVAEVLFFDYNKEKDIIIQ